MTRNSGSAPDAPIYAARLRAEQWCCSLCRAQVDRDVPKCPRCGAVLLIDMEEAIAGGPRA